MTTEQQNKAKELLKGTGLPFEESKDFFCLTLQYPKTGNECFSQPHPNVSYSGCGRGCLVFEGGKLVRTGYSDTPYGQLSTKQNVAVGSKSDFTEVKEKKAHIKLFGDFSCWQFLFYKDPRWAL